MFLHVKFTLGYIFRERELFCSLLCSLKNIKRFPMAIYTNLHPPQGPYNIPLQCLHLGDLQFSTLDDAAVTIVFLCVYVCSC